MLVAAASATGVLALRNWIFGYNGPQPVQPDIEAPVPDDYPEVKISQPRPLPPPDPFLPPAPHGYIGGSVEQTVAYISQKQAKVLTGTALDSPFTAEELAAMRSDLAVEAQAFIERERESVRHQTLQQYNNIYQHVNFDELGQATGFLEAQIRREFPYTAYIDQMVEDSPEDLYRGERWLVEWLAGDLDGGVHQPSFELREMILNHQRLIRELVERGIPVPDQYMTVIENMWGVDTPPWKY